VVTVDEKKKRNTTHGRQIRRIKMKQEQKHFIFRGEKVSFGLPLSSEQYLEAKHLQLELKGTLLLLKQIEVSF
jgi:hypothetical protein